VDQQEKIPAASIAEVERFWADGENAIQSSTGTHQPGTSTTDLIDLPGVGVVPGSELSPLCAGRESDGGGVSTPRGDSADGVHTMSLNDRLRASITHPLMAVLPSGEIQVAVDYRVIAKELLTALYGMIGHFGMPIKNRELADEVETALRHAEVAKVDEVLL
jgi:hypothetical protein